MDAPFSRWYPAIEKRRSRRHFDASQPIEPDKLSALDTVCKRFVPFPGARTCLVTEPVKDVFKGLIGSYGKIKGAPAFIAFIGDMGSSSVHEEVGYTGEGIILEATALGLNTCWVAGFFKPESVASLVEIKSNERVLAVTPVGYTSKLESLEEKFMTGFGRTHRRVPISRLITSPTQDSLPEWIWVAIQAARLAPSAVNRQPWGFDVQDGSITVYVRTGGPEFNVSKRLDCGIAMLHIEAAALNCGVRGDWQLLKAPRVARFNALV
ncbi:nitroreductase family protein [Chloroflexota bacterium]